MEPFKTAPSLPDFVEAEYFAIHMLAQEHHQLSGHFARGAEDNLQALPISNAMQAFNFDGCTRNLGLP